MRENSPTGEEVPAFGAAARNRRAKPEHPNSRSIKGRQKTALLVMENVGMALRSRQGLVARSVLERNAGAIASPPDGAAFADVMKFIERQFERFGELI